ncbi:TetR/AcrR family transcriptional regulator [Pseudonocardia lutea]|uniref:TetR/AcrR family transcriptional regulator n=1 Tax=Pseudonocardia lutea TaxID=2172015 RepID=A0ABW1I1N3_9PSEU
MSDSPKDESAGSATAEYLRSGLHPLHPLPPTESDARRRLLVAARDCFAEDGYQGTSTRMIAGRAGMSPAAMYIHYPSKQAVLLKLCLLGHAAAFEALRHGAELGNDPRSRLKGAVYAFAFWHAESPMLGRVVQWEVASLEPVNFELVATQRRTIEAYVRGILDQGAQHGAFSVMDLHLTTVGILSLCIDLARWVPLRPASSPSSIAATYAALAERMVSASPP